MTPLLEILSIKPNQAMKQQEATYLLANRLELSEAERTQPLPNGKGTLFNNRLSWAKVYLMRAGLLDSPKRGHFSITQRGLDALRIPNLQINNQYLKQFDEFIAFFQTSHTPDAPQSAPIKANKDESKKTPDETLHTAYNIINNTLVQDILERTCQVTPTFFEQLLIDLLIAMGYGNTEENMAHALSQSGNNSIGGIINQDPLGIDQTYIQATRHAQNNKVDTGEIRDFFRLLNLKNTPKGVFITTSDFTDAARETAQALSTRIVLVNGNDLAKLMLKHNIGSRDEQILYLKKIDEDFFRE